jgi:hypothetical protein
MKQFFMISFLSICFLSQSFATTEDLDFKLGIKHPAVDEASYNSKYSIALVSFVSEPGVGIRSQVIESVIDSFENAKRPLKFITLYTFDKTKKRIRQVDIDVSDDDKMESVKTYVKIPPDELAARQTTRARQSRKLMENIINIHSPGEYEPRDQKEITFAAIWELAKEGVDVESLTYSSYEDNRDITYDLVIYYVDRTPTGDAKSLINVVVMGTAVAKKLGINIRSVEAKPVWAGTKDWRASVKVNLNGYKDVSAWKVQTLDKDWKAIPKFK